MARTTGKAGTVLFSPHIHSRFTVESVMWDVVIALLPAGIASVIFFGSNALRIMGISVATAIISELIVNLVTRNKITIFDGSAVITGLLFAYNMPPSAPWYLVIAGSAFAIVLVKGVFGGLGYNFMNPALGGRIFVLAAWSSIMVGHWSPTIQSLLSQGLPFIDASAKIVTPDAITSATPLTVLKSGGWPAVQAAGFDNIMRLFLGNIPGCIGETSKLAILIGCIYLLVKKVITWEVPVIYLFTVGVFAWIFGGLPLGLGLFQGNPIYHLLSGGVMLGACFMANDSVTSPISFSGNVFYAVMLGLLTMVIRLWGGYPEGASYAIVLMNIFVPLIDRGFREKIYGTRKPVKAGGQK